MSFPKKLLFAVSALFSILCLTHPVKGEVIDQIVAEVNGEIITYSELKRLLDPIYAQYSKVYSGEDLISRIRAAREEALNQLIENKLILQEAKEIGLELNESAVEERLNEIKSRFPSEEVFLDTLKNEGTSYDSFVDRVRDQLMIKALIGREVTSKVIVSPKEIEEFYQAHKKAFSGSPKVHLFHIMVKKDPNNMFLSKETASQLYKKLKEGGSFEQLAKDYSEGPNADKGGDLGYVEQGQLIEPLSKAAFATNIGDISDVIESQGAYHILLVKDKIQPEIKPLTEVESNVQDAIFREKATKINDKWIASLKEKAYINIFE